MVSDLGRGEGGAGGGTAGRRARGHALYKGPRGWRARLCPGAAQSSGAAGKPRVVTSPVFSQEPMFVGVQTGQSCNAIAGRGQRC